MTIFLKNLSLQNSGLKTSGVKTSELKIPGWLALDIDGTLTDKAHYIPQKVLSYLEGLYKQGWKIIVSTGRSYPFALPSLSEIKFPFILSTQNGAAAWHMPEKKLIFERFFQSQELNVLETIIKDYQLVMIAYGEDYKTYYKKNEAYQDYMQRLFTLNKQTQIEVENFSDFKKLKRFSSVKVVGVYKEINSLKRRLQEEAFCESALIKDPFYEGFYLLMLTNKGVSKGSGIAEILKKDKHTLVIAAGNDNNDLSMFEYSHIKIAMDDSPKEILKRADIIAPSAKKEGIIKGLKEALLKARYKEELKIGIEGLKILGVIGIYSEEREKKQEIVIDLEVRLRQSWLKDDINTTLDYEKLIQLCKKIVEEKKFLLLETLAKTILDQIFQKFSINKATICIKKSQIQKIEALFLNGAPKAYVKITRERS